MEPLLLNEGDEFWINVIGSNFDTRLQVTTRVIGVKEIEAIDYSYSNLTELAVESMARTIRAGIPIIGNSGESFIRGFLRGLLGL